MGYGHRTRKTGNMAVKIHNYFSSFRTRSLAIACGVQLLGTGLSAAAMWWLGSAFSNDLGAGFIWIVIATLAINLALGATIVAIITKPFGTVAQAIAHVSDDPVVTPPPDVKTLQGGLKELVQTVYTLAVAAHPGGEVKPSAKQPNNFFEELVTHIPCGIVALDSTSKVVYANPIAPVADAPGGGKTLNLNFEAGQNMANWLADCRANKVRDTKLWLRTADKLPGEDNRRIFDVVAYYQKENPQLEVMLALFDRTAVYATAEEDMDFIALAAHELRGPITVIRGYLDVLNEELADTLDADRKKLLERLQVSSERLSGYVNNILNVSRYDRNQFKTHRQEEKITTIVAALLPDLALRARTQNRTLSVNIPGNLPTVAADRTSIGEVLSNLVDNAIKYSFEGGNVQVKAEQKDNFLEVTVQDTGIGMPSSVVGNLFNRFYRSHRSRQTVAGTGLGLYICKAIVEAHGGIIWVRSVEGQGSTFGFTLPTYASVADSLKNGDNKGIVQRAEGWIKNHAMYRG